MPNLLHKIGCPAKWCALVLLLCLSVSVTADTGSGHPTGNEASAKQEILDVISQYSFTYDSKDVGRWLQLFTKDAVWSWYGPKGNLVVQLNGTREMNDFFAPRLAGLAQQGVQTRHFQTNTVITYFKKNVAKAKTYVLVTWQYSTESAPRPVHTGYYEDTFVKTSRGWKFRDRVIYLDHD